MILYEKLTENWKLRGLKLRGLRQNQISKTNFRYENDQCIKINTVVHFEIETPTNMTTTHAESFSIFLNKKSPTEKSYYPRIHPIHRCRRKANGPDSRPRPVDPEHGFKHF